MLAKGAGGRVLKTALNWRQYTHTKARSLGRRPKRREGKKKGGNKEECRMI